MRRVVNYFRSLFCKHHWALLREVEVYRNLIASRPTSIRQVYRCSKCGYVQKVEL